MADADAWCTITVSMLEGTDNRSACRVFQNIEGYVVRFQSRAEVRDVKVVEVGAVDIVARRKTYSRHEEAVGFLVYPVDDNGERTGPDELVPYEDVEAIGVY